MTTTRARARTGGFTLVEVIVVLALIGLVVGIGGLALASLELPREAAWASAIRDARTKAIRTGQTVSLFAVSPDSGSNHAIPTAQLFLPDGRAIGPGLDPLTGAPDARR